MRRRGAVLILLMLPFFAENLPCTGELSALTARASNSSLRGENAVESLAIQRIYRTLLLAFLANGVFENAMVRVEVRPGLIEVYGEVGDEDTLREIEKTVNNIAPGRAIKQGLGISPLIPSLNHTRISLAAQTNPRLIEALRTSPAPWPTVMDRSMSLLRIHMFTYATIKLSLQIRLMAENMRIVSAPTDGIEDEAADELCRKVAKRIIRHVGELQRRFSLLFPEVERQLDTGLEDAQADELPGRLATLSRELVIQTVLCFYPQEPGVTSHLEVLSPAPIVLLHRIRQAAIRIAAIDNGQ